MGSFVRRVKDDPYILLLIFSIKLQTDAFILFSNEDSGKVVSWLHSHVKLLQSVLSLLFSIVLLDVHVLVTQGSIVIYRGISFLIFVFSILGGNKKN